MPPGAASGRRSRPPPPPSGRSVLISGLTVMVAMAGMFLTGDATFASFGVATIIVVAIGDARLADCPAGAALEARRQRRPRARAVRRPASTRRRRGTLLGRDHRPRPAPAGALRRPRRRAAVALALPALQLSWSRRARTRSRSRWRSSRPTTGCSRRSPARRCRPTSSSRPRTSTHRRCATAIDRLEQRALASGRMHEPITVDVTRRDGREHHRPDRRERKRRGVDRGTRGAPRGDRARDRGRASERRDPRHRGERAVEGQHRQDEVERCRSWSRSSYCSRSG